MKLKPSPKHSWKIALTLHLVEAAAEARRRGIHIRYAPHDPRAARYWDLVAIMKSESPGSSPNREWAWIAAAMKHHLAD